MALEEYRKKRKFEGTPEPSGAKPPAASGANTFVVQKHDATRLHYDLRLEIGGVMPSWAVPKGPSLNPADKRLAMRTEDHPLDYAGFEGIIPEGNYGAGTVMVWDNGTYEPEGKLSAAEQLARGEIKFKLHGRKLHGSWVLVRTRSADPKKERWLLIKHRDEAADTSWDIDRQDWSVLTGRTLREIAEDAPARPDAAGQVPGAKKASMPAKVEPMLATLVDKAFSNPDWLFELKWDGMRVLAFVKDGRCELQSRRLRRVTSQFPELANLPALIDAKEAIVDGEAVVLDESGRPDFGLMQQRMNVANPGRALLEEAPIVYYAFDLLYCDGYDLRDAPLIERKRLLKRILKPDRAVRYSDHVEEKGEDLSKLARERGLEGIVGKYSRGRYCAGRSGEWVKLKTTHEVDAVIGGFTAPRGSGRFGALLAGLYEGAELRFIAACGSGFDQKTQEAVWAQLGNLVQQRSPFSPAPETREKATWVKPVLVARVKYSEWTRDRRLRAPVFLGLRTDIDPQECRFESEQPAAALPAPGSGREQIRAELCGSRAESASLEIDSRRLKFTNLNKTYFPRDRITKRDLLCYYLDFADLILPFLRDRPLVLRRRPNGMSGKLFYQKDAGEVVPDWLQTVPIYSEDTRKEVRYAVANDLPSLLFLTNLGCIDHNPWSSRVDDLDHPDYVFFDLDPTEGTDYATVVEVSRAVYEVLHDIGLKAYMKTSGASGFHLFLPVERVYTYEQVRTFTEIVMRVVGARLPDKTTFERIVERRPRGRVLLDFNQISYSRPLASVYSVRPVDGACVSAPVSASELRRGLNPEHFTIKTMPERIRKAGDLWADFWQSRQRLEAALDRLHATLSGEQAPRKRRTRKAAP